MITESTTDPACRTCSGSGAAAAANQSSIPVCKQQSFVRLNYRTCRPSGIGEEKRIDEERLGRTWKDFWLVGIACTHASDSTAAAAPGKEIQKAWVPVVRRRSVETKEMGVSDEPKERCSIMCDTTADGSTSFPPPCRESTHQSSWTASCHHRQQQQQHQPESPPQP